MANTQSVAEGVLQMLLLLRHAATTVAAAAAAAAVATAISGAIAIPSASTAAVAPGRRWLLKLLMHYSGLPAAASCSRKRHHTQKAQAHVSVAVR